MTSLKSAIWLFITLTCLASSGWYFASSHRVFLLDEKTLSASVDTIMHQVEITQYGKQGQLTHYLQTTMLTHTPKDNAHYLHKPHIIVNQPDKPQWEIHADHARTLYNGKQIVFHGHVHITQAASAQKPAAIIKTEELTYFPESQFATTPKKIEYKQQNSVVTATGMNAYLEDNRIQLFSQAQGTYVSSKKA